MSSPSSSHSPGPSDTANRPHILPIPSMNDSDPLSGRTDEYFWSTSLPNDTIVCQAGLAHSNLTTRLCCLPQFGIYSAACRMSNTTANVAFFRNCTTQYSLEEAPEMTAAQVNVTCVPFATFLAVMREQRANAIARTSTSRFRVDDGVASVPVCASVGYPGRFNYTGQCCARLGGSSTSFEGGVVPGQPGAFAPMDCAPRTDDTQFSAKFSHCLDELGTWPVCAQSQDSSGRPGDPSDSAAAATGAPHLGAGLLLAGAALALIV